MIEDNSLFAFPPAQEPHLLNPLVLAYVGDAVYEMFIRQYVVSQRNQRPNHLHKMSTRYVSAKAQAKALEKWLPHLSEEEVAVVKRGRNAKSGTSAKNADILEYRHSTAFECLIGYLYYTKRYERLNELLQMTLGTGEPEPPASVYAPQRDGSSRIQT
ncbi:Mini-ribonuclease 3 [Paenibacillus hamazuiensis]|uniref:Mini-ribonuclease 3 n=1 Tax=Paenibacillus hamazuiensis TaxID=2936508 RepID=UPI00200EF1B0|nr:Mini-ribonuclease 3 [Paenibacillus hamazuiensis]